VCPKIENDLLFITKFCLLKLEMTDTRFDDECKELLKIFRFKNYRRHGQWLKTEHNHTWQVERSLTEFVWGYCRTPQNVDRLVQYLESATLDENALTKWLTNANNTIDPDITFMNMDEAEAHLHQNRELTHVHVLEKPLTLDNEISECSVDYVSGDLFHGVVVDGDTYNNINNIVFTIALNDGTECQYISHKSDLDKIRYVIQDNADELYEQEDLYYVVPLFKHPIPMLHLETNEAKMSIRVVPETPGEQLEVFPIYSITNALRYDWLAKRTLKVSLTGLSKLSIGPDKIKMF